MSGKQIEGMRQRRSREEVGRLVDAYDASGLGRQEFCKKHGLSLSTLNRHRKQKQQRLGAEAPGRLIPVEISGTKRPPSKEKCVELLVWLSSGRRIEVRGEFDAKVLEQLVRALEQA